MKINENYANVKKSYLFIEIAHRLRDYMAENPGADIIKMGIGDVTLPLVPVLSRPCTALSTKWAKRKPSAAMSTTTATAF